MIKSCYIHIPFCNKICSYCDFPKLLYNANYVDKYLDSLEKEIKSIYKNDILDTLYIGGGTPSSLSLEQLSRLFNILGNLKKSIDIEYTIECNFSSLTKDKLELFKKVGVNRISLGIESIDKNNLKLLEREEYTDEIVNKIKLIRDIGINNINVDLMYALPGETIEVLEKDLDFILSLDVEHISTYSLIIEDHTKLKISNIKNIDEDLDYEMYRLINNKLKSNGYKHYEISNYSKDCFESRHNKCYWLNDEYYGFGLGAASYIDNKRITNTRSITKYINNGYSIVCEDLDIDSKIEYEIMLNLRLCCGIDLDRFKNKYGIFLSEKYDYNYLVNTGLLILNNNCLFIPEDKLYISNQIIVKLLQNKL